ncbi:sensor histidine kinase [Paraprevotella xylaniphila]|jgi:signal transduction histidine kinase|uniref:sensor histidine kinase n=1 Tax=Paraprevotella xylaniphila TaxID=454155 RepID=UPI0024A9C0B9|nr:HAMP domain-containing sensor histidine kinase [Paraprevotella xylaniphila]
MKLLRYTHFNLSFLLFLLLGGWGTFFYYTVIDEVMDETDDALANYRDIIVGKILADSTLLDTEDKIIHSYSIRPLATEEVEHYRDRYYDGTVYIETEDEYEPVRIMKSCFMATDLKYYELELRLSTLERDDLITAIFKYLVALYIALLCCIIFSTRLILKSVFRPLDRLLEWLENVSPGRPAPYLNPDCRIREFRTLNRAALEMHERAEKAYREQKEFIENASHELQTPLAVINGKLELLAEHENLDEEELKTIDDMFRSLHRAIQLNKSLLLLSRIQNRQFEEVAEVDMNRHARHIIGLLSDLYEKKELDYHLSDTETCRIRMNESLAHTLLTNLIKNAIIHSPDHGRVDIVIHSARIEIINDGNQALDKQQIFKRFYKGNAGQKESTGLGLSIAQSIANLYHIKLTYYHDGRHHFVLKIAKP